MSKRLRELVELFGSNNQPSDDATPCITRGPFYCGVSFEATLSSFCIPLQGPTSTTTQMDVSMNFSGDQGIIITLDNKESPGDRRKW